MKRLIINVSGLTFEVTDTCLERYPNTLLGDQDKRAQYYTHRDNTYFFNRHRLAFEGILMFYQSYGRVACPPNVPAQVFQAELKFFEIECKYLDEMEEAKRFVTTENTKIPPEEHGRETLKTRVWRILQDPGSSIGAQMVSIISLSMTIISICLSCLNQEQTKIILNNNMNIFNSHNYYNSTNITSSSTTATITNNQQPNTDSNSDHKVPLEAACFVWFTLEFILRFFSCPKKALLLKSWIDITDIATLLIFYISIALTSTMSTSSVLRIFRLANAFRVFRLTRFSNGLRLLIYTIYTSRTDLQLLSSFMMFFIMISGSCVYFADVHSPDSQFREGGIFSGFWFSLISCTTVGYGDIVPVTLIGKFVAALTITFGAMFILLPVLKLVSAFSDALQATRAILNAEREDIERLKEDSKLSTTNESFKNGSFKKPTKEEKIKKNI